MRGWLIRVAHNIAVDKIRADAALGKAFGMELGEVGQDVVHAVGEFTAGALIGGVHNAGHETLFQGMQGNGWNWSWGTFSGGAAQGVTGVIGRGLAAGLKIATMTVPAEPLLARGLGEINPAIIPPRSRVCSVSLPGHPDPVWPQSRPPADVPLRAQGRVHADGLRQGVSRWLTC